MKKLNFLIGILSVSITFLPGILIGEYATIFIKTLISLILGVVSFLSSFLIVSAPYGIGFIESIMNSFVLTAIGRGIGVAFIIFAPILIFDKFSKLEINWLPAIILLIPALVYIGGIRQIQRYMEIYDGVYLFAISGGFILGTFVPLYLAYEATKKA